MKHKPVHLKLGKLTVKDTGLIFKTKSSNNKVICCDLTKIFFK